MILDQLTNWNLYGSGEAINKSVEFLSHLKPDCAIGEYPILGGNVYAKVMDLMTVKREDTVCEAHRRFIDIQMAMKGEEFIDWYPTADLTVKSPYDEATDIEFYQIPETPGTRIKLEPGLFAVFFPGDAHVPLIMTGDEPQPLKLVCIKMDVDLYFGRHPDYS
jgi:YhcH/YjgK/YiaL family protein